MPMNYKTEFERYKRYYLSLESAAKKPAYHSYTAAIFSFLAISLFGWYAILPTMRTILFLRREIVDNTKVNKQMDEKIAALIEAQEAYERVEPKLSLLSDALPKTANALPLVSELQYLARDTESSISSVQVSSHTIQPTDPKPENISSTKTNTNTIKSLSKNTKAETEPLPVSLTVTGSYPSIDAFLQGITTLRRIVTIESIKIEPSQTGSVGSLLQLVLQLTTYYTGK